MSEGVTVELRGVSVRAGNRLLLRAADARFAAGDVTLIVGRSGAGKSTVIRLLAGLLDEQRSGVEASGAVLWNGSPSTARSRCRTTGVVFQQGALLDELSPVDNVRLAQSHRPRRSAAESPPAAVDLLRELSVPADVPTGLLSGGQRQRLAIARTLAYDPDVILYDEPTAGLDAATAAQVARRIRETHDRHRKTTVIVTHDYASLAPIAERIYLLDAERQELREIPAEDWPRLRGLLEPSHAPIADDRPRQDKFAAWRAAVAGFFARTTRALESLAAGPYFLLPLWRSPWWGARFLFHYLRLVAGPSAWIYILLSGMILGFVATHFTFRFLPYAAYTKPLLIEDLLMSMGFALFRILVPVLTTLLVAARCGAAVASDIGGKSYGQQLDALRTMGISPSRYLLGPILQSFLLGTPLLTAISYAAAAATSLVVFVATHPQLGPDYWNLHFHRVLTVPGQAWYAGSWWVLAKVLVCGFGVGLLAYHRGARPQVSGRDVSNAITSTILWSTLLVLVVHFVFAFFEFGRVPGG